MGKKKDTDMAKRTETIIVTTHDGGQDRFEIPIEEGQRVYWGPSPEGHLSFGVETMAGEFVSRVGWYAHEYWANVVLASAYKGQV